jgi:orotidine-5'-phosphate decarboxylase
MTSNTSEEKKNFADRLAAAITAKRSILCGGVDPQVRHMPTHLRANFAKEKMLNQNEKVAQLFLHFAIEYLRAIATYVCCVKFQAAFWEIYGGPGLQAMAEAIKFAHELGLIVILDAKRGDGSDTVSQAYAPGYLGRIDYLNEDGEITQDTGPLQVDGLTVNGYIGDDCITHFVKEALAHGNGIFVVTKTSFKPNSAIEQLMTTNGGTVWENLASMVNTWGENSLGDCGWSPIGAVMGATYPDDGPKMRKRLRKGWLLIPGYGAQGGGADGALVTLGSDGFGGIVNNSRGLMNAWCSKDGRFNGTPENFAACSARISEFSRDDLNTAARRADKGHGILWR